jgi:hypothetical protein
MKNFFTRYSYDSVRMLLDQIVISIFGFSLALAATQMNNDTFLLGVSIGAIIFYLVLLYGAAFQIGSKDKTSVELGRQPFRPFTGTLVSLLANSLNLILAVIITVFAFISEDGTSGGVPRAIALLLQGMYQGVLAVIQVGGTAESPLYLNSCWWVYFLLPIPALLISTGGYIAGVKGWRLTGFSPADLPASDRPTRKEYRAQQEEKAKDKDKDKDRAKANEKKENK